MKICVVRMLVVVLSIGFASCKKDKEDRAGITAMINGKYWESGRSTNFLQKITPDRAPAYTQATIAAYTDDYRSVLSFTITDYNDYGQGDCLRLATFSPVGTATDTVMWMGSALKSVATMQYINGSEGYNAVYEGELVITACDGSGKVVSGTFSFVGTSSGGDTVRVTNGKITDLELGML